MPGAAACAPQPHALENSLHVRQKSERNTRRATGAGSGILSCKVTMHPRRTVKPNKQLWAGLPDKAITLGTSIANSIPLKRECLASFCFLVALLKKKLLEIRSFAGVLPYHKTLIFWFCVITLCHFSLDK